MVRKLHRLGAYERGNHYNYFRYYDSETGRFVSQDVIGLVGGLKTPDARAIEKSTVAIFKVELKNESKTLYAASKEMHLVQDVNKVLTVLVVYMINERMSYEYRITY